MKLQIHFPKGPAAKELQLPLWDSSRIFQVESRGEMHGVVGIFEFPSLWSDSSSDDSDDHRLWRFCKGSRLAPW